MTEIAREAGTLTRTLEHAMERMTPVQAAGEALSRRVHDAVLEGGEPTRRLADTLHGTWLGHPLHPLLTDVTIGAWMMGTTFDLLGELLDDESAREAADRLILIGTLSAVPTAASGLIDFSAAPRKSLTPGLLHAVLNYAGLGLYTISLRDRAQGRRGRGILLSTVAVGLASASAWLGGHLVYRHRVGVDHADRFDEPDEWTAVLDDDELAVGRPRCVELDGGRVLLVRDVDAVHAIGAVCSHAGGPLEEGRIEDGRVTCPWHDSVFDLRDGSIRHGPATQPQASFETRVQEGRIEIRLRRL